jgi:hypothetical protein
MSNPNDSIKLTSLKEKVLQVYSIAQRLSKVPDLRGSILKCLARPNTILRLAVIEQIFKVNRLFRNAESICVLFMDSHTALNATIKKYTSEEERELIFELYSLLGGIKFVTYFLQQPDIEEDRVKVGASLQLISNFNDQDGSKFALAHLVKSMKIKISRLTTLIESPDLLEYLKEELVSSEVTNWLSERNPAYFNSLQFHAAVEDFKCITSRRLMKTR